MKLSRSGLKALFVTLALAAPAPIYAQSVTKPTARVVSSCGTPPYIYTAGNSEPILQDTTGTLCNGSSGSGGTVTQGSSGSIGAPWFVQNTPATYSLLANASTSGPNTTVTGGNYLFSIGGTFGGATVTLTATYANGLSATLGTYTSATSNACMAIASTATVQATVAGGSPSSLNATLGGIGSGGCAAGGGGTTGSVSLLAGQNGIGNVGGKTIRVCVTPTVTASNSYGINYVVGGLLTFSNAFTSTGSGILQGISVNVKKVESNGFTFYPFNANPSSTTWTDAAVANINSADVQNVLPPISLAPNNQLGTHTNASAVGLGQPVAPGSTTLYGVLLANAALTNQLSTTSDVQVCATMLDDE